MPFRPATFARFVLIAFFMCAHVGSLAANNLGGGAVLDRKPMGTAELFLLCAGKASIPIPEAPQQLACLHYLQGFLDGHAIAMGLLRSVQSKDPSITLPKGLTSCIDLDAVSSYTLLSLFREKYGSTEAMTKTPNAYTALVTLLLEKYPCK